MTKARSVALLHALPRHATCIITKAALGARPPRERRGCVAVASVIICVTVLRLSSSGSKRAPVRTGFIFPVGTPASADQRLLCAHESRYHQLAPLPASSRPTRQNTETTAPGSPASAWLFWGKRPALQARKPTRQRHSDLQSYFSNFRGREKETCMRQGLLS